jgi:hypothetical protein
MREYLEKDYCAFEVILQGELPFVETEHFSVYYYPDSTAYKEIDLIKTQREESYRKIVDYLQFTEDLRINLYLFENEDTKKRIIGYEGAGWACKTTIAEVYNEQCKLNPYHELVHIITCCMYGDKISAASEGLAVYLSNLLNNVHTVDNINASYKEKVREMWRNSELFSLRKLLSLNIGTEESKPHISYPQSASFIEFQIKKLGKNGCISLYDSLNDGEELEVTIDKVERAFGQKLEVIEKEWIVYALS